MNRENYRIQKGDEFIMESYNIGELKFFYSTLKEDNSLYSLIVYYGSEPLIEIHPGSSFFLRCSVDHLELFHYDQ